MRTECDAVICVRGLKVEGSVCKGGGGLSRGRPRLRTAASLSFLFDDVPHHKALNTQMERRGNWSILTGGEMGWPIPQGDLISFNVSLCTCSAVTL